MKARTASVLAWSVLGLSVLVTAAGWWLTALNSGTPIPESLEDVSPGSDALLMLGLLPFSVVGSLIVARRPGNPIGSVFLATGFGAVLSVTATQYAIHASLTDPGSLPAGEWAACFARPTAVNLLTWEDGRAILAADGPDVLTSPLASPGT